MTTYFERYINGEYEQVLDELIALGDKVRDEPTYSDAYSVAQEIMRRVRANVEILVPRLEAIGYQFGGDWLKDYKSPLSPPLPDAQERILEFEAKKALIPITWRACSEIVGDIDFRGDGHPDWEGYHDELMLEGSSIIDQFEDWEEYENDDGNLFLPLTLFDCFLHKRNISGVGGVGSIVPNEAMDVPLYLDYDILYPNGESLVHYLRVSILQSGGFPGILVNFFDENTASITHLDELVKDLIPF